MNHKELAILQAAYEILRDSEELCPRLNVATLNNLKDIVSNYEEKLGPAPAPSAVPGTAIPSWLVKEINQMGYIIRYLDEENTRTEYWANDGDENMVLVPAISHLLGEHTPTPTERDNPWNGTDYTAEHVNAMDRWLWENNAINCQEKDDEDIIEEINKHYKGGVKQFMLANFNINISGQHTPDPATTEHTPLSRDQSDDTRPSDTDATMSSETKHEELPTAISHEHLCCLAAFKGMFPFIKEEYFKGQDVTAEIYQEPADTSNEGSVYLKFHITQTQYESIKRKNLTMRGWDNFRQPFEDETAKYGFAKDMIDIDWFDESESKVGRRNATQISNRYSLCFYLFTSVTTENP